MKLYMFRTVRLSIIRRLFTIHSAMVYVIQVCRQLSSRARVELQFHPGHNIKTRLKRLLLLLLLLVFIKLMKQEASGQYVQERDSSPSPGRAAKFSLFRPPGLRKFSFWYLPFPTIRPFHAPSNLPLTL